MRFDTDYKGRIIQVAEALSHDDAVSNQILGLHQMFTRLGLSSSIYSKWHDQRLAQHFNSLDDLVLDETDVVIYHFSGEATHTWPVVFAAYCTRVLVYHNITPHEFFPQSSPLHAHCMRGRKQLESGLDRFHAFWGDSQFNLDELIGLGASPEKCALLPIMVQTPEAHASVSNARQPGSWLFVGRVAPNKGHVALLRLFAKVRYRRPDLARSLNFVGGYETGDSYYRELQTLISLLGLEQHVRVLGKLPREERDSLYRSSTVYVSLSAHEGFGVPLVEAAMFGLPVVALGLAAIPETLGESNGVAVDIASLETLLVEVLSNADMRCSLLARQVQNATRFSPSVVEAHLHRALRSILPVSGQFRTVSVIICTYNRRAYLERVLDYLKYQISSAFEVVIVDGPSDDGTKELLARVGATVKIAHNPERNLSVSRNLGIELADGDVVAFIDDDALPFDNWIANILAEYAARPLTTAGLGGPAYYAGTFWFQAQDNGVNSRAEAKVNIASTDIGKDGWWRYNTGTNATFSTQIVRSASGFDEQFDYYLDESELCLRLQQKGQLIGYAPSVVVRHEFAQSHNRRGRLNYNWFTICKNTAYFASAYSGLETKALEEYLRDRMMRERISPLDDALAAGTLDTVNHERHAKSIWAGVEQGLADAAFFPRTRDLSAPPDAFRPFPIRRGGGSEAAHKRLHICIVSKEFPPFAPGGGIGTLYYHLASELLLMGHRITAIVPGSEGEIFRQGDICVHYAGFQEKLIEGVDGSFTRNIGWSLVALKKIALIHQQDPIDVVESALWDVEALALSLLPSDKRPPLVVRLVTPFALASSINQWNVPEETSRMFIEAEKSVMANADALIPISESIASSIEDAYDLRRDARWQLIPCGIAYWPFFDVNQGYNEFPVFDNVTQQALEESKIVVFIGRLERRKGIDLVLMAANRILDADPAARLIVAGRDVEGWTPRTAEFVRADLRNRIHFLGEIPDSTRDKVLGKAHCLLFPSRYESFGLVPLEAFVHGVPVIASIAGAIPEVVQHNVCGLLVNANDSQALADAAVQMLCDLELHARLKIGALQRVRHLSSRRSALLTERLYESLLR